MSPNVSASSGNILNIEEFIVNVENRPAIWNRNYHCNKPYLNQMWTELMEIHKLPIVVLKAKWKGLRDNFRVEYKRIPRNEKGEFLIPPEIHDSKWIYYYSLQFLTDHMRHRQPRSEQDVATVYLKGSFSDQEEIEQTLVEPDLSNGLIQIADSDDEFNEDDDDDFGIYMRGTPERATSNARCDESREVQEESPPKPVVKLTRASLLEMMRANKMAENAQKNSNNIVAEGISGSNTRRTSTTNTKANTNTNAKANPNSNSILNTNANANINSHTNATTTTTTNTNAATRYANGYELSSKLKRPRLSEDSNFNGSSTMDNNLPDDDDYHYLLSLHPYMKQLTAAQKLRIRTKIQKIIFKELYKEDLEEIK